MMNDTKRTKEDLIKELEELRQLASRPQQILEGVLIIDFAGNVLYCNESALKMFGFEKPEDSIGKNVYDFLNPKYREMIAENMAKVFKGEGAFLAPYQVKTRYGKEFWIESLGQRITYQDKPAELVVIRDITERKKVEMALRKSRCELEVKVEERTKELSKSNKRLRKEISEHKKTEKKLKENLEITRRILQEVVGALASAVEAKDPHTAGHQKRVAELASMIAKELGLSEEQVNVVYFASIIHDIGKIHIPAEILTKPGRLSEIELSLIRSHTKFGYEILKDIEFPWPIAQIVYQHHEKMDGSGYPVGLSGNDIIFEARIVLVADVVEAISNYRPYRPALGVEVALNEISKNKGILYDPDVVKACLKVFRKKKFKFSQDTERIKKPFPLV